MEDAFSNLWIAEPVKQFNQNLRHFSKRFISMSRNSFNPYNQALTFGVNTLMTLRIMLTKRKILLVLGVVVAIVIGLYTGLFGMTA